MSRTYKDRPYWVQVNDSPRTDHNHLILGRTWYKDVPILDKHGNEIFDEAPWGFTATEIMKSYDDRDMLFGWVGRALPYHRFFSFREVHPTVSDRKVTEARNLCALGKGDYFVTCGVYNKLRVRKVPYSRVKDYCTAGEKYTRNNTLRRSSLEELPCTPADEVPSSYVRWMSGPKATTRKIVNGKQRRIKRDTLNKVKNAWNSGYDVDDFDQDVDFSHSQPDPWSWYLY